MCRQFGSAIANDMRTRDRRDLCIELLMADLLVAENLLVEVLIDAQSYRALAQLAIHRLHDQDGQIERQRQTVARLRDETRCLRELIVREAAVAA